ncbi:hypothetical protein PAEPH01_2618 [Pancytospora epiphaga]|nr:hypothetical protein PAEPH01_2618 [Pancytospora epiphaga]
MLLAIDHYFKWVEAIPLAPKDSHSVAKAIEEIIIKKHGIPERILPDQGLEFKNLYTAELSSKYAFTHDLTLPDHHTTIEVAEQAIQTFSNKLLKLCESNKSN